MGTFQVGDIVELKSGGPAMTVSEINERLAPLLSETVTCDWFSGGKRNRESFSLETLVKSPTV